MKNLFALLVFVVLGSSLFAGEFFLDDTQPDFITKSKVLVWDNFQNGIKNYFNPDSQIAYSPKKTLIRSAIIPGWGHLYVHKPLKGLIYFSAEVFHVYQAWYYNDIYQYVKKTRDYYSTEEWSGFTKDQKNQAIRDYTGYKLEMNYWRPKEKRNKRIWWCGGIYIMSMLDSYVDAHLSDFPKGDMEFINDEENQGHGVRISFKLNRGKK